MSAPSCDMGPQGTPAKGIQPWAKTTITAGAGTRVTGHRSAKDKLQRCSLSSWGAGSGMDAARSPFLGFSRVSWEQQHELQRRSCHPRGHTGLQQPILKHPHIQKGQTCYSTRYRSCKMLENSDTRSHFGSSWQKPHTLEPCSSSPAEPDQTSRCPTAPGHLHTFSGSKRAPSQIQPGSANTTNMNSSSISSCMTRPARVLQHSKLA